MGHCQRSIGAIRSALFDEAVEIGLWDTDVSI